MIVSNGKFDTKNVYVLRSGKKCVVLENAYSDDGYGLFKYCEATSRFSCVTYAKDYDENLDYIGGSCNENYDIVSYINCDRHVVAINAIIHDEFISDNETVRKPLKPVPVSEAIKHDKIKHITQDKWYNSLAASLSALQSKIGDKVYTNAQVSCDVWNYKD